MDLKQVKFRAGQPLASIKAAHLQGMVDGILDLQRAGADPGPESMFCAIEAISEIGAGTKGTVKRCYWDDATSSFLTTGPDIEAVNMGPSGIAPGGRSILTGRAGILPVFTYFGVGGADAGASSSSSSSSSSTNSQPASSESSSLSSSSAGDDASGGISPSTTYLSSTADFNGGDTILSASVGSAQVVSGNVYGGDASGGWSIEVYADATLLATVQSIATEVGGSPVYTYNAAIPPVTIPAGTTTIAFKLNAMSAQGINGSGTGGSTWLTIF